MKFKLYVFLWIVTILENQLGLSLPFPPTNELEKSVDKDEVPESDVQDRENILFHLYTRLNPTESFQLFLDDTALLHSSPFNRSLKTKLLIHGFTDTIDGQFIPALKNAFLEDKNTIFNVIAVDWGTLCGGLNYYRASKNTKRVGKYIAKFVDFLVEEMHLNLTNLHIIGHSLGAHTAGIVARHLTIPRKVSRITALDPALPLFNNALKTLCLKKDDAEFVDVIHTDGGTMGFLNPIGHVDFYPNGGVPFQPGCGLNLTVSCNHARSWLYYEESVTNKNAFPTKRCENLSQARNGECHLEGESPNMGEHAYYHAEFENGLFYTKTNEESPFSIDDQIF